MDGRYLGRLYTPLKRLWTAVGFTLIMGIAANLFSADYRQEFLGFVRDWGLGVLLILVPLAFVTLGARVNWQDAQRNKHPKKWTPPIIIQWIATNKQDLRIGLSSPTNGAVVDKTPIEASGRVVGLPISDLRHYILGFVVTDKEYEQGSGWLDKDGYWKISEIHLGATTHQLFFRLYDESGRQEAESIVITVIKRSPL